ncbi:hypothetical protein EOB59_29720, partial [Mesorhizobium sp. M7A.F.Ca.MR.176.00.0.0]
KGAGAAAISLLPVTIRGEGPGRGMRGSANVPAGRITRPAGGHDLTGSPVAAAIWLAASSSAVLASG